jgi:capsid protein
VKLGRFVSAVPEKFWPHRHMPRGWDYTDPVSEVQSDLIQIDMGIKTPQMIAAERGRDWEEMQAQLQTAAAVRRLAKLPDVRSNLTRHPQLGAGAQADPLGWEAVEPPAPKPPPTEGTGSDD